MKPRLSVHTLTILTTNMCTAARIHCCMNSGPKRRGAVDCGEMRQAIQHHHRTSLLKTSAFAGGEPTMLKKGQLYGYEI